MRIPFPHCQMLPECGSYVNYLEAARPRSRSSQPHGGGTIPYLVTRTQMLEHTFGVGPGRLDANCHGCSPSVNFAGVVELLQYISDSYNYSNIRINRVRDAMRPNMARRSRGPTERDRCISRIFAGGPFEF
jgi:hypothetical protein